MMADAFQTVLTGTGSHFAAAFAAFAQTVALVAVTALWQSVLIAVALVLCLHLAPRVSAAHRFAIWAAAFAVVAALPFLPIFAQFAAASVAQSSPLAAVPDKPWFQLDSRFGFIIAALWLVASALRAADLAFHSLRLRKLWKSATPVAVDPSLRALLAAASSRRRSIEICTTRELDRPSVIGFLAPRILIPDWLFSRLTLGEFEHVIQHEAEHIRRRDDWTNLLQKFSLVLFPLNPALVWMERRLCREREMACDEGVVRRTQAPRAYAGCLTSLAERSLNRRAEALSLGAFQRRPELVRRVHSILWRKRALHPVAARALVGAVACSLLAASVELARCPQMIAFVPEQQSSAARNLASARKNALPSGLKLASNSLAHTEQTDAAAEFQAAGQVRMIDTKAILPPRSNAHPSARSSAGAQFVAASQSSAAHESEQQSAGLAERETLSATARKLANPEVARLDATGGTPQHVLLKADAPSSAAASVATNPTTPAAEPQFIVFTAWEQVQTLSRRRRAIADYDTGANTDTAAASQQNGRANNTPASQPATQITVTRVILAVYPVSSASPSKASHTADSNSHRQAAVPFDGGWLVFEL